MVQECSIFEKDHKLVTTGVYGIIRHPIYSGGLIGVLGLYTSFKSVVVLIGLWRSILSF
jgi:protein-S-isoprenylcysteine O-methyltransferase Ste14